MGELCKTVLVVESEEVNCLGNVPTRRLDAACGCMEVYAMCLTCLSLYRPLNVDRAARIPPDTVGVPMV